MERGTGLRDTGEVPPGVEMPGSRTRTLSESEAAVGARWERSKGTAIGRYVVQGRIGAGAMGVVYRAHDPKLDRHVAIKMSHASQAESKRGAERFAREARAMAALHHPNVVQVYDFGVRDGEAFLVMELLDATTVADWLETNPSVAERMRVLREAGEGLAAAHEAGLVHRDFKPANVLITRDGVAKVTDFGLARAYGEEDSNSGRSPLVRSLDLSGSAPSHTVTAQGVVVGTPAYMSPEQHRARPLTPQSDQYSFCLTGYELLTGRRLFDAPTLIKLEMLKEDGPPLDAFRELPLFVDRALRRGLQPNPRDRFRDLSALLVALRRRPLRSWAGLSAALVLPIAAVAVPSMHDGGPDCASEAVVQWNDAERDGVRDAFIRASTPGATEAAERVIAILDGEALAWVEARAQACELEAFRRDLAHVCLERRKAAFDQLRDRIAIRRAVAAEDAVKVASELKSPLECLQPAATRLEAARANPRTRAYLDEVERHKALAEDAFRVADRFAAEVEIEAAIEAVANIEPPVLRSKPLSDLGNLLDTAGNGERAAVVLREAYGLAAAASNDRAAASAAIRLIWVEGVTLGRGEEGRRWAREAAARMSRFTPRPDMAAARLINLAAIAQHDQDLEASLELMLQADVVGETAEESVTPARQNVRLMARARRQHNIGVLHFFLGDYREALPAFQRSVAATQAARGLEHPDVVDALEGVSRSAEALGELDLARVSAKSMIRILEKHRGKDHPSVGVPMRALASVEYAAGDLEEVRSLFERIIDLLESQHEHEYDMEAAAARVELSAVLRELGRIEEAAAAAEHAYLVYETVGDPRYAGHRGGVLREMALIHSDLGKHDQAVEYMERATVAAGESAFETLNRVVFAIARVYILNGAKRFDEAIEAGEEGLELATEMPDAVDTMLLQLRFAEALIRRGQPSDLARARTVLDDVRIKAQRVGAEVILHRELPDTEAELDGVSSR